MKRWMSRFGRAVVAVLCCGCAYGQETRPGEPDFWSFDRMSWAEFRAHVVAHPTVIDDLVATMRGGAEADPLRRAARYIEIAGEAAVHALPALAAATGDSDVETRRMAMRSIAHVFDAVCAKAAAGAPNKARAAEARQRARRDLGREYGAAMRPALTRAVDSRLIAIGSKNDIDSILDALWAIRVDAAVVVPAIEGLKTGAFDEYDTIQAMADYDEEGTSATQAILRLVKSGDLRQRQAGLEGLVFMGVRARSGQGALIDEFLMSAPSSRPESRPIPGTASRKSLGLRDRIDFLEGLAKMGPAPDSLVRRLLEAIESNPTEHGRAMTYLGILDPTGRLVIPTLLKSLDGRWGGYPAYALGSLGSAAAHTVPDLIRMLESDRKDVVDSAIEALGGIGAEARAAAPALARIIDARRGDLVRDSRLVDAFVNVDPEPEMLFLVLSPGLIANDLRELDRVCSRLEKVRNVTPPVTELIATLREHGADLDAHRAAFLLARHGQNAAAGTSVLTDALKAGPASLQYLAARALEAIGSPAAGAIPDLVARLREEARIAGETSDKEWNGDQRELCQAIASALGAMGSAARGALPAMKESLSKVFQIEASDVRGSFHEEIDRIEPPERARVQVLEDPSLSVAANARWIANSRVSKSRPVEARLRADPGSVFRLLIFDIRLPGEFSCCSWTRELFLKLDETGTLEVTGEVWRHERKGSVRQPDREVPRSVRLRSLDVVHSERLEMAFDEDDTWIEIVVLNPFRR